MSRKMRTSCSRLLTSPDVCTGSEVCTKTLPELMKCLKRSSILSEPDCSSSVIVRNSSPELPTDCPSSVSLVESDPTEFRTNCSGLFKSTEVRTWLCTKVFCVVITEIGFVS